MNIIRPRESLLVDKRSVYSYWIVCVLINASLPLMFASDLIKTCPQYAGISAAILTFIIIYSELDSYVLKTHHADWSKQLRISGALKVLTFLLPVIETICGVISISIVEALVHSVTWVSNAPNNSSLFSPESETGFWPSYLVTLLTGVLLSIVVGVILLIVRATINLINLINLRNIRNAKQTKTTSS